MPTSKSLKHVHVKPIISLFSERTVSLLPRYSNYQPATSPSSFASSTNVAHYSNSNTRRTNVREAVETSEGIPYLGLSTVWSSVFPAPVTEERSGYATDSRVAIPLISRTSCSLNANWSRLRSKGPRVISCQYKNRQNSNCGCSPTQSGISSALESSDRRDLRAYKPGAFWRLERAPAIQPVWWCVSETIPRIDNDLRFGLVMHEMGCFDV